MTTDTRTVFVIHGRNEAARKALFDFLRSIALNPLEWSQAIAMTGQASPYIGDVLDAAFGAARAVVVLQTPDDVAYLHESLTYPGDPESSPQMQPRPNVLFEAGMAMGRDPDRTVIVELGQIKSFSDIHGRHVVRLDNSTQRRQELANRLRVAGCSVDTDGIDWHTAGNLTPLVDAGLAQKHGDKSEGGALAQERLTKDISLLEERLKGWEMHGPFQVSLANAFHKRLSSKFVRQLEDKIDRWDLDTREFYDQEIAQAWEACKSAAEGYRDKINYYMSYEEGTNYEYLEVPTYSRDHGKVDHYQMMFRELGETRSALQEALGEVYKVLHSKARPSMPNKKDP